MTAPDPSALLLGEALHRFSNNLQIVMSATNGLLRGTDEPHVRDGLRSLQDRLALLAGINRRLSGPFGPETATAGALSCLCADLAASFDRADALVSVSVTGEVPSPERRRTVLLLVAELMTNALKHALAGSSPRVRLDLNATGEEVSLCVRSADPPARPGARPRIAAELARSAGGTLDAAGDERGFRVTVRLPAPGHHDGSAR